METLGYAPHVGARAMKTRRTNTIGVVVADLSNPFFTELLHQLTLLLDDAGQRVVVWNSSSVNHKDALRAISNSAIDGVVFSTATPASVELAAAVERRSPVVLINREVRDLSCDRVVSDNVTGAADVADLFVQHGRVNAAFIGGLASASTSQDRERGFLERMDALGWPVPEHLRFHGDFSHDTARQIVDSLLSRSHRPSAIFCVNDFTAFGALDACQARAVTPEECWVAGYDDVQMASWDSFSLTSVRQPIKELAAVGVEMLLQRIADPSLPPRRRRFPAALIVRGSTPI